MMTGFYLSLIGALGGFVSITMHFARPQGHAIKELSQLADEDLISQGLWDECSGEPMNAFAEEHERRHGISAACPTHTAAQAATSKE